MNEVNSESLVVVCPRCDGDGRVAINRGYGARQDCTYCDGNGYLRVMTKAEFDKRYQERHSLG